MGSVSSFVMLVQNFGGLPPQKKFRAKNVEDLVQFRMTSNFGGKYLWNGWIYPKLDSYLFGHDSSRVRQKQSAELGPLTTEI